MARRGRREAGRRRALKLCSLLLSYPDAELLAARAQLRDAVSELPRGEARAAAALQRFCEWWLAGDELAIAQHYVATFDLQKRSSLYLSFYGQGDRRDRGVALLRLKKLYRAAGLPIDGGELPDYLPAMLEFAAEAAPGRGELVLGEHRPAIELLRLSLHDQESPYAHVLDAVTAVLGETSAADRARALALAAAGPPTEAVGLEPFAPPEVMPAAEARR